MVFLLLVCICMYHRVSAVQAQPAHVFLSVAGKTSGKIAPWGTITGTLADSVDSFILCYEPLIAPGAVGRPYPANIDEGLL